MLYKVYVIYSREHDKLFTGMTTSLGDRMESHNSGSTEERTTGYQPWTLIHMELFSDEGDALLRETYLKSYAGQAYVRADILPLFDF